MVAATDTFSAWLDQAQIAEQRLTAEQQVLLQAAFRFRQSQGSDYYSGRFLSHFLLHCECGLKVAQIARLVGISRPTASRQQRLSSKEAIHQAHHRLEGRSHGKLLPRYAGPIAQFLLGHPQASRTAVLDFVQRTFGVSVSRVALYKFLKKYGLDSVTRLATPLPEMPGPAATTPEVPGPAATTPEVPGPAATTPEVPRLTATSVPVASHPEPAPAPSLPAPLPLVPPVQPVFPPAPPFCADARSTPVPSC